MTTTELPCLEREINTFESKKSELLANAEGKFALVFEDRLIATFNDEEDAIAEGYKQCGNVPFLVRQVVPFDVPANFVNNNVGL